MTTIGGITQASTSECGCDLAAEWDAYTYRVSEIACTVKPLASTESQPACNGRAVVLPDLNRVECVLDASTDFADAAVHLRRFVEDGWDVWAVVPLARVGDAHLQFAGGVEYIQGWWPRGDGEIAFTAPEVP